MGEEQAGARIRERVWVMKVDKTTEPPTPVEEVLVEDGIVVAVRTLTPDDCAVCGAAEPRYSLTFGADTRRYCTPCWTGGVAERVFQALKAQQDDGGGVHG